MTSLTKPIEASRLKYSASCNIKKTTGSVSSNSNSSIVGCPANNTTSNNITKSIQSSSSRTKQIISRSALVNNQTSVGSLSNTKKRQPAQLSSRDKLYNMSNTSTYTPSNSSNNHYHSAMMPSVASRLKKNIARTKEKILQGMGKSDRTSDESFDSYVENFEHQYIQANKLNKELNKYLHCLKETQKSSKMFYDTLKETYETSWPGSNLFYEQTQLMELKWSEYLNKLINQVQLPLMGYLSEFPEYKKKIEKRHNRLLDYDDARHTLEGAQTKSAKKQSSISNANGGSTNGSTGTSSTNNSSSSNSTPNTPANTDHLTKLTKLKIDLEDKQNIYEEINQNLCTTLPVLYADRIKFYASLFQSFFHSENIFHSDCVEIKSKLDDICENLSIKSQASCEQFKTMNINNVEAKQRNYEDTATDVCSPNIAVKNTNNVINNRKLASPSSKTEFVPAEITSINDIDTSINSNSDTVKIEPINTINGQNKASNTKNSSKVIYLYRVKATYAYEAKEVDELSFSKDEVIDVIEGTESEKEDLDEGWLIGIHETTLQRGLFPENFTKRM